MAWTIKSQERYEDQVKSYLDKVKADIAFGIQLAETEVPKLAEGKVNEDSLRGALNSINEGIEALTQARHIVETYPNEVMESSLFSTPLEMLAKAVFILEVNVDAVTNEDTVLDRQAHPAAITRAIADLKASLDTINKIWIPQFFTQPGEGIPQEYETGMWNTMRKLIRNLEQTKEKSKTELLQEEIYGVPGIKWKFRKPRRMTLPPHSQQMEREREKRSVPKKFF